MSEIVKNQFVATKYFQQNPAEALKRCGPPKGRLIIPGPLLHGIEDIHEYSERSLDRVARDYERYGVMLLALFPLACCALPVDDQQIRDDIVLNEPYLLTIMDGHHRKKVGLKRGIINFPVELFSVPQASRFFLHKPGTQYTYKTMVDWLLDAEHLKHINQGRMVVFRNRNGETQIEAF